MPGPDFPTGGTLVEDRDALLAAYETGRGGFRTRAKWAREDGKHGTWTIVVTEIPYQVQKARLIEQIAQLLEEKKLPLLADVRDESTEDVRLVLEPKSRTVDPAMLMETLFPRYGVGKPLPAQHERADRRPHARRARPARRAARVAGPPPRSAAAPFPATASRRSTGGWRSSTATSRCSSTSTR